MHLALASKLRIQQCQHPARSTLDLCALAHLLLLIPAASLLTSSACSLKHRRPNMSVLVVLGTTAAYIYSIIAMCLAATQSGFMGHVYFESSALIITFICLGKWISARAKARAGNAVRLLLGLTPKTALLVVENKGQTNGSKDWSVKMQDLCVVKPAAAASVGVLSGVVEVKEVPVEMLQVRMWCACRITYRYALWGWGSLLTAYAGRLQSCRQISQPLCSQLPCCHSSAYLLQHVLFSLCSQASSPVML